MGELASPTVAGTITEEDGVAAEGQDGRGSGSTITDARDAGDTDAGAANSSGLANGKKQADSEGTQLSDMRVDTGFKGVGTGGAPPIGQVSPASDFRRGSMSPGVAIDGRYSTLSWSQRWRGPNALVVSTSTWVSGVGSGGSGFFDLKFKKICVFRNM